MPEPQHVMLIEDEPNIAEAISFILGRDGWRVSHVADGALALSALRGDVPQLVILDMMLPGMDGIDILKAIRADTGLAQLPVLMLTAKGLGRDREAAERAGADRFMAKPFSNGEIVAAARALVGR